MAGRFPRIWVLPFASADGLYYYVSAYDTEAAKHSPGTVHMNLLIMSAIDDGLKRFDFLRGEAGYKEKLGTTTRILEDRVFGRGLLGPLVLLALQYVPDVLTRIMHGGRRA